MAPSTPRLRRGRRFLWFVALLCLALLASSTAAFAGGSRHWRHRGFIAAGTVASIGSNQFTITKRDGSTRTFTVSDRTVYVKTVDATIADAAVGSIVFAKGTRDTNGTLQATRIAIKPAPSEPKEGRSGTEWVFGQVTANDGTTITVGTSSGPQSVQAADGAIITRTFKTQFSELAVGNRVVVFGRRMDDGTLAARWVYINAGSRTPFVKPAGAPAASPAAVRAAAVKAATADSAQVRLFGVVSNVSAPNFTLFNRMGQTTVTTSGSTTFVKAVFVWTREGGRFETSPGSFADIVQNAKVKVEGTRNSDGSITATKVVVFTRSTTTTTWSRDGTYWQRDGDRWGTRRR